MKLEVFTCLGLLKVEKMIKLLLLNFVCKDIAIYCRSNDNLLLCLQRVSKIYNDELELETYIRSDLYGAFDEVK